MSVCSSSGSVLRPLIRQGWMLPIFAAAVLLGGSVTVVQRAFAAGTPPTHDHFANATELFEKGTHAHLPLVDLTVEPADPVSAQWHGVLQNARHGVGTLSAGIYGTYDTTRGPALTNY
jgi:hypothetical protein